MILALAIAESSGNKAEAISDTGERIIVQERYSYPVANTWLHVWRINMKSGEIWESDLQRGQIGKLKEIDNVDPDADYWRSI